jgi:hypothetical protein
MDTPVDERKRFDHVTSLISSSVDEVSRQGCLALDIIEQVMLSMCAFLWIFQRTLCCSVNAVVSVLGWDWSWAVDCPERWKDEGVGV